MRVAPWVGADAMSRLDDLPPDQRAVLMLQVQQGKSHAEIAALLGIPESAVRERARAALDALAGAPVTGSATATPPRASTPRLQPPASRRAGALLLGAILAIVVIVVVVVSSGGGSHGGSHKSTASGSTTTSTAGGSTGNGEPHVDKQLNLVSPDPTSKAVGLVEVLSEGSKRAFLVTAEHLPPNGTSFFYAAWLYNSPSDARVLGRAPNVTANGQLQAVGSLPTNAGHFRQLLITRETSAKPSRPGPVVLNGPFSLH